MLNWGVIGPGGIARVFCNGMRFTDTGQIFAVASRTKSRAESFADVFDIPRRYGSYEALLADGDIDAVYVATIHPHHAEWVIKAAEAKKHILVEKPISIDHATASTMVDAARKNDVFLMEAFMYRCHPQIQRMAELIQDGAIGEVRFIQATFGFQAGFNPEGRLFNREMGGGGILDIGCYTASIARKVAGAAAGKLFLDPISVKAHGKIGPTGVDHIAAATMKFENEIIAEIVCAVECNIGSKVIIYGSGGTITIPSPWLPSSPCRGASSAMPLDTTFPPSQLVLNSYQDRETTEISVEVDRDLFTYEADMVANHISDRQAPAMSWDDTLGNMKVLDAWREEIGVVY